ncbi:glutaredoxin family protein [Streptomyces phyllanthi]|uniref:Glutaredoxin family protein n=1 Tax=Streptomyces phyllanthi TaxID=1803180 RepID=A0A5N8W9I1_9ACTN|nr:glutaredoxin family protein [Streptomyces phyllanthi]MPY42984.1 glutaredoxin family protein [Streptomyces phyllanthi]
MAGMSPIFRRADRRAENPENKAAQGPESHLVTLVRKPGCHLCDDAHVVVEKVCAELGVPWEQKDITQDEELHREYWEQIPVVLIDGKQHTFWRVNEQRLRKALTSGLTE